MKKPDGGYLIVRESMLTEAWEWYHAGILSLQDLKTWLLWLCGKGGSRKLLDAGLYQPGSGRAIPFPRRLLRWLSIEGTRATIATTFGLLLRCAWIKGGEFRSFGRCKAAWIVARFQVSMRAVKGARAQLIKDGWVERVPEEQWALNRWGGAYRLAPPCPTSAPPDSDSNLPERIKTPNLRSVVIEDLKEPERTLKLHRCAVKAGLVNDSEHSMLQVFTAAVHAMSGRNPPALFATILRMQLWKHFTSGEEDVARARLQAARFGSRPRDATEGPQHRTRGRWPDS
jgi:hypothetical protein